MRSTPTKKVQWDGISVRSNFSDNIHPFLMSHSVWPYIANLISWTNVLNVWMHTNSGIVHIYTILYSVSCSLCKEMVTLLVESSNFRLVNFQRLCIIMSSFIDTHKIHEQILYKIVYGLLWFKADQTMENSIHQLFSRCVCVWALLGLFYGAKDASLSSLQPLYWINCNLIHFQMSLCVKLAINTGLAD